MVRHDRHCSILRVLEDAKHQGPLTEEDGGLAQLGEHLLCKQGVKGSIPLISTKSGLTAQPGMSIQNGSVFISPPKNITERLQMSDSGNSSLKIE